MLSDVTNDKYSCVTTCTDFNTGKSDNIYLVAQVAILADVLLLSYSMQHASMNWMA